MGVAKAHQMNELELNLSARQIALDAGALQVCDWDHDEPFEGDEDPVEAYKLAAVLWKSGDPLASGFGTLRRLTDRIKTEIEACGDSCSLCDRRESE